MQPLERRLVRRKGRKSSPRTTCPFWSDHAATPEHWRKTLDTTTVERTYRIPVRSRSSVQPYHARPMKLGFRRLVAVGVAIVVTTITPLVLSGMAEAKSPEPKPKFFVCTKA